MIKFPHHKMANEKIGYIFDHEVGLFNYGEDHPMDPMRVTMTHSLVSSLGLSKELSIYKPAPVEMSYHPENYFSTLGEKSTDDCPNFSGLKEYTKRYSSASVNAAQLINNNSHKIVINWGGGMHHGKKNHPSGFCYLNDIVMCIQKLLEKHNRVMYIDIDVHHGDAVEEAFYFTDRVLTLSFHKHGDFYPDTGDLITTSSKAINVPLRSGISDDSYFYVYKPILDASIKKFNPDVIVFQSGADSLAGDRLGVFSLSFSGHGRCLKYARDFGIPMVVLGGGGYTIENVSRLWAYETSILCNKATPEFIPKDDVFYQRYGINTPYEFILNNKRVEDRNNKKYLNSILSYIQEKIEKFD